MVLAGIGSGSYFNFLGLHILELGGSQAQVGMAYGASAMAEIPIMFLGARWFHRYGNDTLITVGLSIFTLGWMTVAAMTSPLSLISAASLVGVGYGFFWVAVYGYANETAPEGMGATAQATGGAAQGGLHDPHACAQCGHEFHLAAKPFAHGDGNGCRARHLGQPCDIIGGDGFFIPQGIMHLERAGKPDRMARRELAVRTKQKIGPVAHRLPDQAAKLGRPRDIGHGGRMPTPDRVGACGVEFDGCPPFGHTGSGGFGLCGAVDPKAGAFAARRRVKIGIGPHPRVHLSTQKRPNRPLARFTQDIPTGHLKPGKGTECCGIGPLGKARRPDAARHQLDILGVLACHMAGKDIFDHAMHGLGANGGGIDLAQARDAASRGEAHDQPVAPTPTGRWRGHCENLDIAEPHRILPCANKREAIAA